MCCYPHFTDKNTEVQKLSKTKTVKKIKFGQFPILLSRKVCFGRNVLTVEPERLDLTLRSVTSSFETFDKLLNL